MTSRGVVGLVVKVAERCNLNCSYCYMYQHEDKSYLHRPKIMSNAVFDQLLRRIREYCDSRSPHAMTITFHGGEPTLIGTRRMEHFANRARDVLGDRLGGLVLQTNGTLLDDAWVDVIRRGGIRPSISLDGPAAIHDSARVDHAGRGSHAATIRGLALLQRNGLDPGILCVVNPGTSGLEAYQHFRSLNGTRMNFLLPDVSHDNKSKFYGQYGETPVADYLIPIFDEWFAADDPSVRVTIFRELITLILGGVPYTDAFGNPVTNYLVIESDGTIHANDALRVCADGIAESGLNVFEHGFDDLALGLPMVHRIVHEGFPLSATCLACPERAVCGGGSLPHRYARLNQFDNPSVWCADILKLLAHIRGAIATAVNA